MEIPVFASKYKCTELIYYEVFADIDYAILREKEIKGLRRKKLALIEIKNASWQYLYEEIL